jgi:hypothetical protein
MYPDVAFAFASPGLGKMAIPNQIRWEGQTFSYCMTFTEGCPPGRSQDLTLLLEVSPVLETLD